MEADNSAEELMRRVPKTEVRLRHRLLQESAALDRATALMRQESHCWPALAAARPSNRSRNRRPTVKPFDFNRVILQQPQLAGGSDYVNASHLDKMLGHGQVAFIAAQSPTSLTVPHFLQMLIEQQISLVLMLSREKEQYQEVCHRYWRRPVGQAARFGHFEVLLVKEALYDSYMVRTLRLRLGHQERDVQQLQFTKWPVTGLPATRHFHSFFAAACEAVEALEPDTGGIVVHCRDGSDRCGVFVALYRLVHHVVVEGRKMVDVRGVVRFLRDCRAEMVAKQDQLLFIYKYLDFYINLVGAHQ